MLKEIWSPEFPGHASPDSSVKFRAGLNVILGVTATGEESGNSLGKSTFLLVIDFCFGGESFLKSMAVRNKGEHLIFFAFEFGGGEYKFCRKTDRNGSLYRCGRNWSFSERDRYSLDEYENFLAEHYGIDTSEQSFRNTLSPFFRIHNKSPAFGCRPMMNYAKSSAQEEIRALEKIFGLYGGIKEMAEMAQKKKDIAAIKKFSSARGVKLRELNPLANPRQTESEIADLERQKADLLEKQNSYIRQLDARTSEELARIKADLKALRRKRTLLETKIRTLNGELESGSAPAPRSFELLLQFFPGANIAKIQEIEEFHNGIIRILREEIEEKAAEQKKKLADVNAEISEKQARAAQLAGDESFSLPFLREYARIQNEIDSRTALLASHRERKDFEAQVKNDRPVLLQKETAILNQIAAAVNERLSEFSRAVLGADYEEIRLEFEGTAKYSVSVKSDDGTSTTALCAIAFDTALLSLGKIPAAAHDSHLLSDTKGSRFDRLVVFYDSEKRGQIFISAHRRRPPNEFSAAANEILSRACVLTLRENGGELYGESFARDSSGGRP